MLLHHAVHNREPQARTTVLANAFLAVEWLEYLPNILGRNAATGVRAAEHGVFSRLDGFEPRNRTIERHSTQPHGNATRASDRLYTVAHEVGDRAHQLRVRRADRDDLGWELEHHVHMGVDCTHGLTKLVSKTILQGFPEIERFAPRLALATKRQEIL